MIDRDRPGAAQLSAEELRSMSQKSDKVISEFGPDTSAG
jgi:hypothetical protein